ncbi:hypothetical protein [Helicobacter ailurogastricus]|uniref:Uncharacterized protein n=1 Tax=Helicobacter ailurogastricus TaxID=1578720 RepID=A0A0K2X5J6_9HELI|nr:hypothetical protein [Helicobacter ailurogastricus]CRF40793.1 hypothetical protein HAL011_05580 [Helicobacter ailurogastricus]CRF42731.1 hypothetical protein HAL013_09310 [Helicobacter ailurogastricus]CRF44904.1 hypothetical protein HAL09_15250 [Helicobacter ailurogastricus]
MNINRFIRNFLTLRSALEEQNFSSKELNNLCMQGALEYEKLHLEEMRQGLDEAKLSLEAAQVKAKIEIEVSNAKHELELKRANALNALIQCTSMLKSLKDNAAINRANAYVGFLQVVGNATNTAAVTSHASNVIRTINQIGMAGTNGRLEGILERLAGELNALDPLQDVGQDVQVFAQSLETLPGHPVKVWGISLLSNSTDSFSVDGRHVCDGCSMLFNQSAPGTYAITFTSTNQQHSASKTINIQVQAQDLPTQHKRS